MLDAIENGVTAVIGYVGDVITAIFGTSGAWGAILPAVGLAVAVGLTITAVGFVKSLIKGY